ncbi:MAG TPA: histidine triad nucleotide-binding protein [Chloroflexota bacterium]|nr:histidine triad nucleotide-binding protein [Chloroflexota bacterium]
MSDKCIFCKIVAGEIPATRVLEHQEVIAIQDANPQAPVHVLVLPRRHVPGLAELPASDVLWNELIAVVQEIVEAKGLDQGFRVVVNQGDDGGQTVPHLHLHVLGRRTMAWPPG